MIMIKEITAPAVAQSQKMWGKSNIRKNDWTKNDSKTSDYVDDSGNHDDTDDDSNKKIWNYDCIWSYYIKSDHSNHKIWLRV